MAELGYFDKQRVELIDGEILVMAPQNDPHASSVAELTQIFGFFAESLSRGGGGKFQVRIQLPLSVSDISEPEPDLAIVEKKPGVKRGQHPCTANLVIEIADSSIPRDRKKIGLYASAAIPEYWIVDVAQKQVTVYTEPVIAPEKEFGADYKQSRVVGINEQIKPVALPMEAVAVERFFG
ncbi:MAG: Uma2 family endonuclease [Phycisphaerales bacterium]|nr:Uma2 family endonuclease [Phycisphaerales bacterium]